MTEDRAISLNAVKNYYPYDKKFHKWLDNLPPVAPCEDVISRQAMFTDYPDMPYQFDNMTGSMNL